MTCVNIKHKDFQKLMEETGLDSLDLSTRMGVWMEKNNTDEWPSLKELGLQSISDTFDENGTTSPESIESGTEGLKTSPTRLYSMSTPNEVVIPFSEETYEMYKYYHLVTLDGKLKLWTYEDGIRVAKSLSRSKNYDFKLKKTATGYRIFMYRKELTDNQFNLLFSQQDNTSSIVQQTNQNGQDLEVREKYFSENGTTTLHDILENIKNTNHPLAMLASALQKFAITRTIIHLDQVSGFKLEGKDINANGYFDPNTNSIHIAEFADFRKGQSETVILHEVLHALSYHILNSTNESKAVVDLKKILERARLIMLKEHERVMIDKKTPSVYALTDIHEIFVALFTDSNFIRSLSGIKPMAGLGKYKNMLEQIFDKILNLLNIKKTDTLYKQAYSIATNILEENRQLYEQINNFTDYSDYETALQFSLDTNYGIQETIRSITKFLQDSNLSTPSNYSNILADIKILPGETQLDALYRVNDAVKDKFGIKDFYSIPSIKYGNNTVIVNSEIYLSNKTNHTSELFDLIEEDKSETSHNNLTGVVRHLYNKMKLSAAWANKTKFVSFSLSTLPENIIKAVAAARGIAEESIVSFVKNGVVYFNRSSVRESIQIEEGLHPFVNVIYLTNPELFNNMLAEATRDFPKLVHDISLKYTLDKFTQNDIDQEIVTQALVRYSQKSFRESGINKVSEEFLNSIATVVGMTLDNMNGVVMKVSEIKKATNLSDIATLVNSANVSFSDNFKNDKELFSKENGVNTNKYMDKVVSLSTLYESISNGLEAQYSSIKNRVDVTEYDKNRLKHIISSLDNNKQLLSVLNAIIYINKELVSITLQLKEIQKSADPTVNTIKDSILVSLNKDYFGFINQLLNTEDGLEVALRYCEELKTLPAKDFELLKNIIENLAKTRTDLEIEYKKITKGYVLDKLEEYSESMGNTNTSELLQQLVSVENDMGSWLRNVIMPSHTQDEVIRNVHSMLNQMSSQIHRESNDMKEKIMYIWHNLESKHKDVAKFIYEVNKAGKFTGNLVSDFARGQWEDNYEKHKKELSDDIRDKFSVEIVNDKAPDNIIDPTTGINVRKYFINARNKWHSENTERRYIKDYYDIYNDLDPSTEEELESIRHQMFLVADKYRDKNGDIKFEDMSDIEYVKYNALRKAKDNLANPFNDDGTVKIGKYKVIAEDLQRVNERKNKLLTYSKNIVKFNAAKAEAKANLTPVKYKIWLERNTKEEYTQKFWDDLDDISTKGVQSPAYLRLYQSRKDILKLYKISDSMEVDATNMPDALKQKLKRIDIAIEHERQQSIANGNLKFKDVAEVVLNKAYHDKIAHLNLKLAEAKKTHDAVVIEHAAKAISDFNKEVFFTITVNGKQYNKIVSIYSKLVPNKNMAHIYIEKEAPNSNWYEIDENSTLLNKEYKNNQAESDFGYIPKVAKYKDTSRMDYIRSNPDLLDYYNMTMLFMEEARDKVGSIGNKKSYSLPQITGSVSEQIARERNILKRLPLYMQLLWGVNEKDIALLGNVNYKKNKRADGSIIKKADTHYVKKLEDTDKISKDHLTSLVSFYNMATAWEHKNKMSPLMDLILEQVGNREYTKHKFNKSTGKKEAIGSPTKGIATENYKFLQNLIDSRLYNLKFGDKADNLSNLRTIKAIRNILGYFRKVALTVNPATLWGAFVEGTAKQWTETVVGSKFKGGHFFDAGDRARASKEIAMYNMEAMRHMVQPLKKPKLESLMERNGILKLTEETKNRRKPAKRYINSDSFYIGYRQLDFHIKAKMLVCIYSSYRFDGTEFLTENEFIKKQAALGTSRQSAIDDFSLMKLCLYDVFKSNSDGQLEVEDKYKDVVTESLENRIMIKALHFGQKLDGTLSEQDRVMAQDTIWGQFALLFRSWMIVNGNERYKNESFNYSTGNIEMGQNKMAFATMMYALTKYMPGVNEQRFSDMGRYRKGNEVDQANILRMSTDITLRVIIPELINYMILQPMLREDPEDWALWFWKYLMQRTSFEGTSVYNPFELMNILNSPSAATSMFAQPSALIRGFYLWMYGTEKQQRIPSGAYKNETYLTRALIQSIPGRSIYEIRNTAAVKSKSNFLKNKLMSNNILEMLFGDETTGSSSGGMERMDTMEKIESIETIR